MKREIITIGENGKVLYREEDVEKLLQENYRPRFEKP